MPNPLIAIVGDITEGRELEPPLKNSAQAKKAAEDIGVELAKRNARLLVYGGHFLEEDVVRGFVKAKPKEEKSIYMWYSKGLNEPPPFPEEQSHAELFDRRPEANDDWEVAFYRSITKADGIVLMGGGSATKISGLVAIGSRMPILAIHEFGGGAAKVWETLSAEDDLPTRDEINFMGRAWSNNSAKKCIDILFKQRARKQSVAGAPKPMVPVIALLLFLLAFSIIAWMWGDNKLSVWMVFLAPLIAGGSGAVIRSLIDGQRVINVIVQTILVTIVLGMVAGGVAGLLFVTAQLTADPNLIKDAGAYASRSIPFAVAIGFIAGFTSEVVFGKLLGIDVVRTSGITSKKA